MKYKFLLVITALFINVLICAETISFSSKYKVYGIKFYPELLLKIKNSSLRSPEINEYYIIGKTETMGNTAIKLDLNISVNGKVYLKSKKKVVDRFLFASWYDVTLKNDSLKSTDYYKLEENYDTNELFSTLRNKYNIQTVVQITRNSLFVTTNNRFIFLDFRTIEIGEPKDILIQEISMNLSNLYHNSTR